MSITKTPYDYGYYYLQQAKKISNCNEREWDKLSKVEKDKLIELVKNKDENSNSKN